MQQLPPPAPIAPELGINYVSNPILEYQYPPVSEDIIKNISHALIAVPQFYIQVCHLMNKMNLPPPFGSITPQPPYPLDTISSGIKRTYDYAENESEKESDDDDDNSSNSSYQSKRPNMASVSITIDKSDMNSSPTIVSTTNNTISSSSQPISDIPTSSPSLPLSTSESTNTINKPKIMANIFRKKTIAPSSNVKIITGIFQSTKVERTCASNDIIKAGIVSKEEIATLPKFQNYSPGEVSNKLYIKNLAKTVTEDDILYIFGRFFDTDKQAKEQLEIHLLKEGRLKDQCFVTFPDEYKAAAALDSTHGFILKGKPLFIIFSKNKSKNESSNVSNNEEKQNNATINQKSNNNKPINITLEGEDETLYME
ncbi:hypothetical protein WA158_003282 [Blastocystis sp. Blastoise]